MKHQAASNKFSNSKQYFLYPAFCTIGKTVGPSSVNITVLNHVVLTDDGRTASFVPSQNVRTKSRPALLETVYRVPDCTVYSR